VAGSRIRLTILLENDRRFCWKIRS